MDPLLGSQPYAVLLCKFSDHLDEEPHTQAWFRDLFVHHGTGGVNDYWRDASRGKIDLDGSEVFGWKNINITLEDFKNTYGGRWEKTQCAVDAFPEVDTSLYKGVVVFYNMDVEDGGFTGAFGSGRVLSNVASLPGGVTWFAHEMGHGLGLLDSFDESPREVWDVPGVYCDKHDIMSAMNVYSHNIADFSVGGPLLNTAAMDLLGWLDPGRVLEWKHPMYVMGPVTLRSLSQPSPNGFLALKCGPYYIEFRTKDGWDTGIPRSAVLIHKIKPWYDYESTWVIAPSPGDDDKCWNHEFLAGDAISLKSSSQDKEWLNIYTWNIKVESIDAQEGKALISVGTSVLRIPLLTHDLYRIPIEFIRVHPEWVVIRFHDDDIITLPAGSEEYLLAKEFMQTLGKLRDADKIPSKKNRKKLTSKLYAKIEKTLRKAQKEF